eukprot:TRINITY_DN4558_c0_g5_i2.p1 TRINITY_DN4558_c0_g5~~TRINITY_DN4558_c0_g5_i2.p1  ORF type:complete len:265 (+),score=73.35 TRINITY_DN4558_c0_g5_i2:244-1038(+)
MGSGISYIITNSDIYVSSNGPAYRGASRVMVCLKNTAVIGHLVSFVQNLFTRPEQTVSFLGSVDDQNRPKWNIIDNYDGGSVYNKTSQLPVGASDKIDSITSLSRNKIYPSSQWRGLACEGGVGVGGGYGGGGGGGVLLMDFDPQDTQILVNNFEGDKITVNSLEELNRVMLFVFSPVIVCTYMWIKGNSGFFIHERGRPKEYVVVVMRWDHGWCSWWWGNANGCGDADGGLVMIECLIYFSLCHQHHHHPSTTTTTNTTPAVT